MLNKLLKSLSLLLLLNLLIKPLWVLLVDRQVQLSVESQVALDPSLTPYGLFAAIYSFTLWFNVILDFGIKNYHNTTLARDHKLLSNAYSLYIPLKTQLSFAYALVMLLAGWLVGDYLSYPVLFGCLVANQILIGFMQFFRASITGLGLYTIDSWLSITDRVLMLLMAVPIFFTSYFTQYQSVEFFVILHSISYVITALIAFYIVSKHLKGFKWNLNFEKSKAVIKETLPFALFTLLMTIYVRSDFVMIERLLPNGAEKAGVYAKGHRLLEAGTMFALLFGNLFLPIFSAVQHKRDELVGIIRSVYQLIIPGAIILVITCYLFRSELMGAYYPGSSQETADAFGLLMLNFISVCLFFIFSTVLTAMHKVKQLNLFALLGLLSNLTLNFILIPKYGLYGAISATLITQGGVGLLQTRQVINECKISISSPDILKFTLWLALLIANYFVILQTSFTWPFQLFLYMALNFTFAFILRLVDIRQLLKTLNETRNDRIA